MNLWGGVRGARLSLAVGEGIQLLARLGLGAIRALSLIYRGYEPYAKRRLEAWHCLGGTVRKVLELRGVYPARQLR